MTNDDLKPFAKPLGSATLTFTREELCVLVEATAHSSGPSGWQARLAPVAAKILEAWQQGSPNDEAQVRLGQHSCNHVWREGPSAAALESKDALMTAIAGSKASGRWLRAEELAWGKELESEGKVKLCCDGKAATSLPNKSRSATP